MRTYDANALAGTARIFGDVDLVEEYVQAGAAVEEVHPVGAGTTLHRQSRISRTSARPCFNLKY